jgi:Uncharacterized protein conserved in bacteria (DUF2272)
MRNTLLLFLLPLTACAGPAVPRAPLNEHVPPFARVPYAPFSRDAVVALALREWRLFGSPVDDNPPGTYRPATPQDKPERQQGLWQRIGEYSWEGLNPGDPDSAWTGGHDGNGVEFSASQDGVYAWSAIFISYVMRIAGAGGQFPYTATHSDYINIAKQMKLGQASGWVITAEPANSYAAQMGDLICHGRGSDTPMDYAALPAGRFPSHCDVVVRVDSGVLTVVGGNVDDAVTMRHVPTTPDGMLVRPDGSIVDTRYGWFVVIRMLYGDTVPSTKPAV